MDEPGYGGTQFVRLGHRAGADRTASHATLAGLRHGLWWFHGLLAISFVAAIPYTKAAHMLAGAGQRSLRDPLAGARLAPIPRRARLRAGRVRDARRLQPTAPARARCLHAVRQVPRGMPANATGRPLSPRDVILELASTPPTFGAARRRAATAGSGSARTTLWSCMQCNACVEICPVGIEQAPIINQLRRRLVEDGELDPTLQATLQTIHKSGNSFGENKPPARALDRRSSSSRSRTRARNRSTCSGSSATTPRSTPAPSASRGRSRGYCTPPRSTSGSSTTASETRATTSGGSARRACSRRSPSRTSRRSPAASSTGS